MDTRRVRLFLLLSITSGAHGWGLNTVASRRAFFSDGFAGVGAAAAVATVPAPAYAKPNDACKSGGGLNCFSGSW